jgi:hypothetical protein
MSARIAMAAKAPPNRMPDRMKSALAPATNVPMLPTTRDTAKVNGIHAAIGPGRAHALAAREVETQEPQRQTDVDADIHPGPDII